MISCAILDKLPDWETWLALRARRAEYASLATITPLRNTKGQIWAMSVAEYERVTKKRY